MSRMSAKNVKVGQARKFDLVLTPVITEKATQGSEHNQVTFRVPLEASKPEIKLAVESLFKVKVKSVNTLRQQGKVKMFRGRVGRRSDSKKAIITLVEGNTIDVTSKV
jgi:large subunit ribosomal protein L23